MDTIKIAVFDRNKQYDFLKRTKNLNFNFKSKIESFSDLPDLIDKTTTRYSLLILTDNIINIYENELLALIQSFSQQNPKTQILLFIQEKNIAVAIQALKYGVYQYVKLPIGDDELKLLIETAIEQQPKIVDDSMLSQKRRKKFGEIIGSSTAMIRVYDQVSQAAHTDIPVFILGETGTGKDLIAHTIHKMSPRSEEPYLAVNLGALPSELVGSELFGHEKGSFTGALQQHKGVFEQGNKGTVFLDEIDTMDDKVQVSLLRLLEQKKFKRLGGTRSLNSKARLIAATNENIDNLVESGVFRSDLFYRLDVFRITLPALRERKSDIPLLVDDMLLKYAKTYKKNISSINQETIDALMNFDWPGNIRELKNAIQRAVLVCNDEELKISHLPPRFHTHKTERPTISFNLGTSLDDVEREMVVHALAATNNNRKEAAKLLGISRRAIYNKLNKYNL